MTKLVDTVCGMILLTGGIWFVFSGSLWELLRWGAH